MKLGVVADNLAEAVALATGAVPEPVVLGAWGLFVSRMLLAGAKLGVFEALSDGPGTAAELAPRLRVSEQGLERLLRALNGLDYLRRDRGTYSLAPVARKWLSRTSKNDLSDVLRFVEDLWRWTGGLEDAVKSGEPGRIHEDPAMTPEAWGRYMRGLAVFAKPAGAEVVRRVKLPRGAKRLLDVGGGHGMYSVAFCQRYPGLAAEVLDLPEAVAHGRAIVQQAGFEGRVTFREGDMRSAEWGTGYDAVLLFNVLHNATEAEATAVVQKAYAALAPGGVLAVQESEYRETSGNLSFSAGFGELFFFLVSGARTWPEATLRRWQDACGFSPVKTRRLWLAPAVVVTGTRPAP